MNFQIKQAVPADGQAIGDLIQAVWAGMDHKEWYVPDDGPHITALLEEGKAIAFLNKIACRYHLSIFRGSIFSTKKSPPQAA